MSFSEKSISAKFSLASGQFQGGGNSANVTGLRIACQIAATGGPSNSTMEMAIYGMDLQVMQQLATVGPQYNQRYMNGVTVSAGDDTGNSTVFDGVVFNAYVDGDSQPDVRFRVIGAPGVVDAVKPAPTISINGSADASGLMSQLAGQMGLSFENAGVKTRLASPYYAGTALDMANQIAQDGNFYMVIDRGTMVILPRGTARQGDAVPISALEGNLVNYPGFVQNGLLVKALYDPRVKLMGKIDVQSALKPASGTWQVSRIDLDLESVAPGGNWFMTLQAIPLGTM